MLRDLFAEGALSSAFVPTFTEYEVRRSKEEAWALANLVIGTLLLIVGSLTVLGMLFAPQVVAVIAPGFEGIAGKSDLTILLTRIMFPFLPLVALSALFMGMLNVRGVFALPAFAPVLFNLVSIAFGLALWTYGTSGRSAVIGWSVGTLCGGFAQAFVQLPRLRRLGWEFRPTLRAWRESEGLRQIGRLMLPAVIGLSATQINILVNTILASLLEQGSPSWLNYAFRLMQLPIGVFGVGIGIVTLPLVSRDAANDSREGFVNNITRSLNLVLLLTLPCAVGLWVMGIPIIRLIYQHGIFHSADTIATATALACYAVGLPAYAAVKVLAPAFYALKDARIPMIASVSAVGVNLIFNLLSYQTLRHGGLALGTSLAALTNLFVLIVTFQRRHAPLPLAMIFHRLWRIVLATVLMAFVALYLYRALDGRWPGLLGRLVDTLVPISVAGSFYFLMLFWLRVPEMQLVKEIGFRLIKNFVRR